MASEGGWRGREREIAKLHSCTIDSKTVTMHPSGAAFGSEATCDQLAIFFPCSTATAWSTDFGVVLRLHSRKKDISRANQ